LNGRDADDDDEAEADDGAAAAAEINRNHLSHLLFCRPVGRARLYLFGGSTAVGRPVPLSFGRIVSAQLPVCGLVDGALAAAAVDGVTATKI
jgi:hypothetical protein